MVLNDIICKCTRLYEDFIPSFYIQALATHVQICKYGKPWGVKVLQFYRKLQNTILSVELMSFTLDSIYCTVNMLHNKFNEFQQFKEFAGQNELNSVDYSGKQRLGRE